MPDAAAGKSASRLDFTPPAILVPRLPPALHHRAATRQPEGSRRLEEPCTAQTASLVLTPPPVNVAVDPARPFSPTCTLGKHPQAPIVLLH